ncbi:DUF262 domain-containing protein [Campylobacter geochelonis]|uniref:Uncharacterized conserved protein n=1 Tax=Campylobacter geochelonis TaxID=1780362 RepID=A0A128EJI0_9BACT|nr:DUF262 domain-containing protein [Campylobacter geochelonis]QKF71280.1 DUF262 and DUF1524 domain-containing protein [Campylobacter geochelonis]CZE48126.1 Uncharacterized conserved protein [Campylobacter geochelonis]CZE49014.1 Uncharacterized conserved protein [Campylobacter geochelonis]CZE51101.1 Uncharacterized conserved protein [Campylobacter geochelonis]
MKAEEQSFRKIMQNNQKIIIPFFQRQYVWNKDNWEQLYEDLYESFESKKSHFLGSLILKRDMGCDSIVSLVDGQQRLTTFSILVKALYDKLNESQKKPFEFSIFADYDIGKPKIQHSMLDNEVYSKIICFNQNQENRLNITNDSLLWKCYLFFIEKIEKFNGNIFEFLKFISDESKLFVGVYLDEKDDEQKIFDSINSTGIPLSAFDIAKNAIFDLITKQSNIETAKEIYKETWFKSFEETIEKKDFWDERITTGRFKRTKSENLLFAFLIIKGIYDAEKHTVSMLSSIFKNYIKNKNTKELEDMLKLFSTYAEIYRNFPEITNDKVYVFEDYETRFFHILNYYNTNTFLPLILFLKLNIKEENKYKKNLYLLEVFFMYNTEMKNYNKFIPRLINSVKNKIDNSYDIIKNSIIETYQLDNKVLERNFDNQEAKIFLFWVELYRQNSIKEYKDKVGLNFIYTLEHLLPQNWEKNYKSIFENNDEAREYIYQLGNMTLLRGRFNTSLQDENWNVKLNGDNKSKHYIKKYADLTINKELLDKNKWDKTEIENRTAKFLEDIYSIWDINIFRK